jgi:GTP-binding protein HflX
LLKNDSIQESATLVGFKGKKGGSIIKADPLDELQSLAESAGARIECKVLQDSRKADPAFFITKGKVFELKELVEKKKSDVVIFNEELSPAQQRNLEDFLGAKVVDRTGLILDIFAQRARSREGKLQIELAQLNYIMPRLSGRGIEMSRLGGGIGTRGPGETKLEMDRRKIKERVLRIKKDLLKVRNTRTVQRFSRKRRFQYPAVLVGYTNAGKSTLLNRLTNANVSVESRLFSTLDPTTRRMRLSGGNEILLSDTVGFIDKLPHQLIQAFKATLEEVREAKLLLHVIDAGSPLIEEHITSVDRVLEEIGIREKDTIYILNKTDSIKDRSLIKFWSRKLEPVAAVSAKTGEGMDALYECLGRWVSRKTPKVYFKLPLSERRCIDRIIKSGKIFYKECHGNDMLIEALIDYKLAHNLRRFTVPSFEKTG